MAKFVWTQVNPGCGLLGVSFDQCLFRHLCLQKLRSYYVVSLNVSGVYSGRDLKLSILFMLVYSIMFCLWLVLTEFNITCLLSGDYPRESLSWKKFISV